MCSISYQPGVLWLMYLIESGLHEPHAGLHEVSDNSSGRTTADISLVYLDPLSSIFIV